MAPKKRRSFGLETNCTVGSRGLCFGSGQGAVVVHKNKVCEDHLGFFCFLFFVCWVFDAGGRPSFGMFLVLFELGFVFQNISNSNARIAQSKPKLTRAVDLHKCMFRVCRDLHLHATMLALPAKIEGQMAILIRWRFGPHCHANV